MFKRLLLKTGTEKGILEVLQVQKVVLLRFAKASETQKPILLRRPSSHWLAGLVWFRDETPMRFFWERGEACRGRMCDLRMFPGEIVAVLLYSPANKHVVSTICLYNSMVLGFHVHLRGSRFLGCIRVRDPWHQPNIGNHAIDAVTFAHLETCGLILLFLGRGWVKFTCCILLHSASFCSARRFGSSCAGAPFYVHRLPPAGSRHWITTSSKGLHWDTPTGSAFYRYMCLLAVQILPGMSNPNDQ